MQYYRVKYEQYRKKCEIESHIQSGDDLQEETTNLEDEISEKFDNEYLVILN